MKVNGLKVVMMNVAAVVALSLASCGKDADQPAQTGSEATPAQFANTRCPIMPNNEINPAAVADDLVREFKGQKVAFCCAGCPTAWDKLTDAEKEAKLAAVSRQAGHETHQPGERGHEH